MSNRRITDRSVYVSPESVGVSGSGGQGSGGRGRGVGLTKNARVFGRGGRSRALRVVILLYVLSALLSIGRVERRTVLYVLAGKQSHRMTCA